MAEVLERSSRQIIELAIWPLRRDLMVCSVLVCPPGETTLVQSYVLRFADPKTFILFRVPRVECILKG